MRSHTLAACVFALSGVTAWQATTLSARSPDATLRSRNAAMTSMDRRSVVGGLVACALLSAKAQQASAATESCDLWGLPCTSTGQVDWAKYGLDAKSLGLPTPPAPPAPPPPPPGRSAAKERAAPKPKPGESDRIELAAARAEDKAQAAAERLALKEQAAQAAAETRAAKRAEAEAEAAKRKAESAKKREAEGGKAGRGEMKPAARAAAAGGRSGADTRKSPKQKAEKEAAAKKVEKAEQCKKNLWGLPCTEDGEVDRTVFGL